VPAVGATPLLEWDSHCVGKAPQLTARSRSVQQPGRGGILLQRILKSRLAQLGKQGREM